jgi:hypothetical protein
MYRRGSHVDPHFAHKPEHEWPSLLLDTASDDFTFPQGDLAPEDPRIQDPNIAPWADMGPEDDDPQVCYQIYHPINHRSLPQVPSTSSAKQRILPVKTPSFSIGPGGIFSRQQAQHRPGDFQDAQSINGEPGTKKSFLGFNRLLRKSSKPSLAKEPSFNSTSCCQTPIHII